MSFLEGQVTPKEFVAFIKDELPAFYDYSLDEEMSFYEVACTLHKEAFCHEKITMTPESELESKELYLFLHTLQTAVKQNKGRIETLYGSH